MHGNQASCLIFKHYDSKSGGSKSVMTALTQGGWGEQNHGKDADVIPEYFLIVAFLITQVWCQ